MMAEEQEPTAANAQTGVPAGPAAAEVVAPASPAAPADVPVDAPAAEPAALSAPVATLPPPASGIFLGTGRRKTSIARVRLIRPGTGKIMVNGKRLDERFPRLLLLEHIREPLKVTRLENAVDIDISVQGGGVSGQAGALRHGIARALLAFSPDLRKSLRRAGCLTRDPRAKERRKCGLKKARKAEQYSKR